MFDMKGTVAEYTRVCTRGTGVLQQSLFHAYHRAVSQ